MLQNPPALPLQKLLTGIKRRGAQLQLVGGVQMAVPKNQREMNSAAGSKHQTVPSPATVS